ELAPAQPAVEVVAPGIDDGHRHGAIAAQLEQLAEVVEHVHAREGVLGGPVPLPERGQEREEQHAQGEPVDRDPPRLRLQDVGHDHHACPDEQHDLRQGCEQIGVVHDAHLIFETATCWSSASTEALVTSVTGFGNTPIAMTRIASDVSIQNSRRPMSVSEATFSLATAPNTTRLYIQSE